jgi:hypothetical protein
MLLHSLFQDHPKKYHQLMKEENSNRKHKEKTKIVNSPIKGFFLKLTNTRPVRCYSEHL